MENEHLQFLNVRFKMYEGMHLQPDEKDMMEKWLHKTGMPEKVEMTPEKMETVFFVLKNRMTSSQFAEKLRLREKEKESSKYLSKDKPETAISEAVVPYKKFRLHRSQLIMAAAASCAVILGIIVIRSGLRKEKIQEIVKHEIVQTKGQEIKSGILPDGSKYWINASSTLRYATRFDGTREVELNGEGYFEVEPDTKKPFIVSSNGQKVQVLGTAFNVAAYRDDTVIRTTVLEGSVMVEALNKKQIIEARQQSVLNGTKLTVLPAKRPEDAISWKRDSFSFKQVYITEIAAALARYYEVRIEFSNGVNNDLYTLANFSRKEPITKILHMIESTNNITFDIPNSPVKKGDVIIIRKK